MHVNQTGVALLLSQCEMRALKSIASGISDLKIYSGNLLSLQGKIERA